MNGENKIEQLIYFILFIDSIIICTCENINVYYIMIKIINKRKGGFLYHYAHFLCDCLFPEIINNIYIQKSC